MTTPAANSSQGVTIIDVCPRDGMQTVLHEPGVRQLSTDEKLRLIERLDEAGVPEIEITGFVHPRVIPSLADADEVAKTSLEKPLRAKLRALVPNYRGARRALDAGVRKVSCLIVASETYQRLNANMSVEENLTQIEETVSLARSEGVEVNAVVAVGFICPYEGLVPEDKVLHLVSRLVDLGITDLTVADSVGLAWPTLVRSRFTAILERWPDLDVAFHLHTLAGLALANSFVAYEAGVSRFEGSVGGIGGGIAMPVETTKMGNVATEDLVYMFESCEIPTGIDLKQVSTLGREIKDHMGTGGGYVSDFGALEDFVEGNRGELGRLSDTPPGAS